MPKKNTFYALLLVRPGLNRIFLVVADSLEQALDKSHKSIEKFADDKDIVEYYALATYVKAGEDLLKKVGIKTSVAAVLEDIQENKKTRNKQDFIYTAKLLKEYATKSQGLVIDEVIRKIK